MRVLILAALLATTAAPAAATTLTGDRIDGVAVASRIDGASLPAGVHRFWYRAADSGTGQGWYVPVVVVRGARPGPRLLVTAGMHGDELNGIDVAHRLIANTDPARLAGTLTVVPGINVPGLLQSTRGLPSWGGFAGANLNRSVAAPAPLDTGQFYMRGLWTDVLRPNADRVVDLHTQTRAKEYTIFVFADPRLVGVRRMAEVLNPDTIKLDPGVEGSIETSFVSAKVPAVTFELAGPERFEPRVIGRAVDGLRNLMADLGMISGKVHVRPAFVGTKSLEVVTDRGGWVRRLVAAGERVTLGQPVAEQRDAFGRLVRTYAAPATGQVASIDTVPVAPPGTAIMRILTATADPRCADGC